MQAVYNFTSCTLCSIARSGRDNGAGRFLKKIKVKKDETKFFLRLLTIFFGLIFLPVNVLAYSPGDSYYGEQWYLWQVRAQQAWDFTRGSENIAVAVLDSGVDLDHPDLRDNIWINSKEIAGDGLDNDQNGYIDDLYGWDFIDNDNSPQPSFPAGKYNEVGINHGTIIAGILGGRGDNGQGIAGLGWKVKIMPLRVLDSEGNGNTGAAVRAIDYAIAQGAQIINMSFVGADYSPSMQEAISRAWQKGAILVAATGNDSLEGGENLDTKVNYPAGYDSDGNYIIGVTATDRADKKANFASYGSRFVDIAAPGVDFFSTLYYDASQKTDSASFDKYYGGWWSGSSVAAAVVSGAAALIKSLVPSLSNVKVRDIILETADNIDANNIDYAQKLGRGRLNIYKALDKAYREYYNSQASRNVLIGAGRGRKPEVKIIDSQGILISSFLAYAPNFSGGVEAAACDLDGDGKEEVVTGAGKGGGPHVRIFDKSGRDLGGFFAFDKKFRGGISMACADVNGDMRSEIIVGAGLGLAPEVKIFDRKGQVINQFLAYNEKFRGGVNVTAYDLNKDGKAEVLTGPASAGGAQVRIFNYQGGFINHFFAYSPDFRGGIKIGVRDLNGDGFAEIVVAVNSASAPYIRVFDVDLNLKYQFLAYDANFRGGVNLTTADLDNDGIGEIIIGPASGREPRVEIYSIDGKKLAGFSVFEREFRGGVNISSIKNQ